MSFRPVGPGNSGKDVLAKGSAPLGHVAAAGAAAAAVAGLPREGNIVRSELSVSNKRGISRGPKARVSRDPSEEFFHHRSARTSSTRALGSHAYDAEDPRVVFVGGVPYDLSANAVSDDFESTFGSVMDVRLVPHRKGKDGEHKGYGFVTFAMESTALSARDAGKITLGGGVVVQIGRAEKGVGRFSDDRSSTTTAASIESGLSEAASFHSYLLAGTAGTPPAPSPRPARRAARAARAREAPRPGRVPRAGEGADAASAALPVLLRATADLRGTVPRTLSTDERTNARAASRGVAAVVGTAVVGRVADPEGTARRSRTLARTRTKARPRSETRTGCSASGWSTGTRSRPRCATFTKATA